jgi:hypothetical protein
MIFGKKKPMLEPSYDVGALRADLEGIVTRAASAGLRHWVIEGALADAATAVATRHAAVAPL